MTLRTSLSSPNVACVFLLKTAGPFLWRILVTATRSATAALYRRSRRFWRLLVLALFWFVRGHKPPIATLYLRDMVRLILKKKLFVF